MANASWQTALKLLESNDEPGCRQAIEQALAQSPNHPGFLFVLGRLLIAGNRFADAVSVLRRSVAGDGSNVDAQYALAWACKRVGTHKGVAEARDVLLDLMSRHSALSADAVREAAECCSWVGPMDKAAELWRVLANHTGSADDYFRLSECLAQSDRLAEGAEALRMAVKLDPQRFGKSREDLALVDNNPGEARQAVLKKGRYPETKLITGDLRRTILEFVAADAKDSPKFITKKTMFFTMGSCFARNIVKSLLQQGYPAVHMEISEYINSTYANRHFVDWLEGTLHDDALAGRIAELLPPGFSKEILRERMRTCDVFVLTLGVAPSFFDRETGAFVMPRPTALNSRALAEKYVSRTTTVAENVDNVLYLLSYIRRINPDVKIVVTESPVPLQMTFEFRSAVVADCLSKSTLRVAAHEIVHSSGLADIYYWPSFEIVRWIGCHTGPVYGTDDGAAWHVSEDLVGVIIACFVEAFRIDGAVDDASRTSPPPA